MKCIKAIKSTNSVETGTIQRVKDTEADQKVDTGNFKYIPKSEWKLYKNGK
jgi:hypothetical protein